MPNTNIQCGEDREYSAPLDPKEPKETNARIYYPKDCGQKDVRVHIEADGSLSDGLIADGSLFLDKLVDIPDNTIIGNNTGGASSPIVLTPTQGISLLNSDGSFDAQVRTSGLDQMAIPTANVDMNNQRVANVANPTANGDAVNKLYTTNFQPQVITNALIDYRARALADGYSVEDGKILRLREMQEELLKATYTVIPQFIIDSNASFNLSSGTSTKFYNAGSQNSADGTLNNFTVDWANGVPIDFRPVLATVNRNISLTAASYQIADTDSITYNYWAINNSVTADDGYIFGNTALGGQCSPRHSGSTLRVSRHDAEIIGVFPYTPSTTTPTMLTFTYNPVTRLYRAYQDGVESFVPNTNSLGSAGELDGDGRLRLVAGKSFNTGNLKIGNNASNIQSFNGKLYEGFATKGYVMQPADVLALFDIQKKKYGL